MSLRKVSIAGLLVLAAAVLAVSSRTAPAKAQQAPPNQPGLKQYLHRLGHAKRGGVDRGKSDGDNSFPHFTSNFKVNGVNYNFTMVGRNPKSGLATTIQSIIIPLRMNFTGFGPNGDVSYSFDPGPAVTNMVASPLYQPAPFPNGVGQFCDQMQRAAFWNRMDKDHQWHVYMDRPNVAGAIDVAVTPDLGPTTELIPLGAGVYLGNVPIDFMDSVARTVLGQLNLDPGVLPIFVTNGVTADALGYHTAYAQQKNSPPPAIGHLQTYIYTSWLDPTVVPPIFADVSTFNHELAEWMNDPFVNNVVPTWVYPPADDPRAVCSDNPYLEVGDPQGNGPTFDDFPAAEITLGGVTYHLQQLVLWQWFADEVPSSAYGGWYTFPIPSSLDQPAVYCQ
jgi:hypothetical protein